MPPCEECRELTSHSFRKPDDLVHAVRLAAEEVDRGVLARIEERQLTPAEQQALDSSIDSGAMPLALRIRFRCQVCGDQFTLQADTQTGTGAWTREEAG
ncbi:MAG TPA: hypothetical protein VM122_04395 [Usitatibacter sp.]|nr:hypothetical protein [Usitatibacter sp.]